MNPRFYYTLIIPKSAIDINGHVNNVLYVQWMQDAATAHSQSVGDTIARQQEEGSTWVAKTHTIDYLKPAYEGETLVIETWAESFRKAASVRLYRFLRGEEEIAKASTMWVYIDTHTARPKAIPDTVIARYM
ncbi:MAG: acyl-CoA thioesterase [Campylobacterales bacterium]|nr:acyl-CoA thioesterase [Campylobacterales bacterium]